MEVKLEKCEVHIWCIHCSLRISKSCKQLFVNLSNQAMTIYFLDYYITIRIARDTGEMEVKLE
ncbi:hypothetical protein [Ruminiclostridium herbifermentans]|uniref:hypothetical protein n=1 Tax=Ruminiclostridium herbifermentans TaxID=2488810 RepID=UPI0010F6F7E0|nr:hypothetical protein [Ruminiclostridium herbifermentans]